MLCNGIVFEMSHNLLTGQLPTWFNDIVTKYSSVTLQHNHAS